jgi:hypothetical protein
LIITLCNQTYGFINKNNNFKRELSNLANTPNLDLENISVLSDTASVYDQIVTEIITKTNNNIAKIDAINISNTGGIDGAVGDGIADDTTAIQTVLSSGGYINFGNSDKIYKITSTLNISSDTVIDGNGATINMPSSATSKSIFEINDKSNVIIKNLKIISVADQARAIVDRIGLTSNLVGIHITTYTDGLTKDIIIQNVYGENLEYLIKADGELNTFNRNILVENIKTYNCVQPIFTSNVDGFKMRHLDLDQKTDVDGHDHHFYLGDYSNNLEITDVIVRRGSTDSAGACSFNIASSNNGTLENINIRNVTFDNINNPTLFSIICVRNITIDEVLADITTAKIPIWFHDVENVLLTNFNISGTIGQLIEGTVDDASYNGLVVLKNSIIDVVMTSSMCSAPNLVIMDNHFTLSSTTSAISFFKYISQAYKMKIENNIFNILAYVNGSEFFDVRVSDGADILINNNTIINSSGTNLAFIIGDSTTAGGTTKFIATNNRYKGYDAFWYATKTLLISVNNINLDNITEETPTTPSSVDTYSVKNFGAKGDFNGTTGTDDTSAIQSALDGGGYISFDSADSVYKITSPLYVSSNSVIDGCGATIFMPSNAVGYGIFGLTNVSNVIIKNFNFKSTADKTRENLRIGTSSNISGINITATQDDISKNIEIKNIYCENLEYGINITGSSFFNKNITIEDYKTYNCCQPISLKYVDGIVLKNLDLDVASDISGSDHHIKFFEFTYNVDIKHLTARRGSTIDGASAFALESSNDNYLENIKISDVNYNGLNTNRIFYLRNIKNCSINGVFGVSTIATCVCYYGGVHNLILTNLNIKGVISNLVYQFIEYTRPYIVDVNYNNLLTLTNSKIDITFTGIIFNGQNIVIKDNLFNLSTTSSVTMIKLLANENSTFKIEHNLINILAQPDGLGLFDIREETGVDVLINNNTFINSIGTDLSFIIMDDTTAGGSSKIVFVNNLYNGFTNIWYATKVLLVSVNNIDLGNITEGTTPPLANVKDFGAKGDGVTDDTTAIQYALDLSYISKMPIWFPSGTYIITKSLYVHNTENEKGISIYGSGTDNTIIKKITHTSYTSDLLNINGTDYPVDDDSILNLSYHSSHFTIADICLSSGTFDEVTTSSGLETNASLSKYGIYCLGSSKFELRNVMTRGCKNGFYFLVPWKANFDNCQGTFAENAFYIGYHTGGAGGTTTILKNCYALGCTTGFMISGISTTSLINCSVDGAYKYAYYFDNTSACNMERCSVEDARIVLRLSGCYGFKVSGLTASGIKAYVPFAYNEAQIYISHSEAIFEQIDIENLVNEDGSEYTNTKDIYQISAQANGIYPINLRFINCILPTNTKGMFVVGDTNAVSSVEFIEQDGTSIIYPNIPDTSYMLNEQPSIKKSYDATTPISCSQFGMVANSSTDAVANYAKLKRAILAGFKILVDDVYYITGNESLITVPIDMVGVTDNAKFYGNGTLFNLRNGCSRVNIENIEFENFDSTLFTIVYFYTNVTSDLYTVEKINLNKNTIKATTRLIYFRPSVESKTVDSIANPWGITKLDICNNKFEETTVTSISLWDVPFKNYNISDNNVKNFKDSLISLGCDEDATYPANLLLSMGNLIVRDNFVFNDDTCWGGDISWNSATSQYYNFVLAECQTVVYQGNHVEGMKSLYKCALYDAYLSCVNVYVANNVWKNNVCFYATKENNTLMKAKGNNGIRYFINNYYSVEKDFVDRLYTQTNNASVVLANAWVYWFDADDGITKWVMKDNTLDIYNLRFSSGVTSAKELWIENNTIKCYRSTGYFLILPNENLDYTGCWHKIRNNTFISTEPYNSSYYLSLFCSNTTQYVDTLNLNILIEGNTFIHPYLAYVLYELDANEVILRNNIFRSTSSDLHIAYSTNKINILRNINNKFEAQGNKKVFENMSSVYGEIEENFEIHDYSATDSSSNLNVKIGNVFTGTYTFLKEYEILSPQGIATFSFTFKYWYDLANTVNKVSFTDSNSAVQTYTCGTSEGHSTYVKITGETYDTVKITFGNYTGMTYFFLSGIDAEDKIIKVRTRCVKSAT